jgi:small-conductance mechanosensitive channel
VGKDNVATDVVDEASHALQGLTWQKGVTALAVLLGGLVAAKLAGVLLRRFLARGADWRGPVFALSKLVSYCVVVVGIVATLHLLGVRLSSLFLAGSALLVGIGFALQSVVQDFIAGIILLVEQPIRRHDYVTFGDSEGTVQQIGLRATHLLTRDGTDVVVPNHLLVTTEVANHSHPTPRTRVAVKIPVSLLEDVDVVRQILVEVAAEHPRVLEDPPPVVRLDGIRGSDFQFALAAWVRDPTTRLRIASELRFAITHAFARAGVRFPTPELLLHTSAPAPAQESAEEDGGARPEAPP